MIRIRAFRAPDDPETSEKFITGHRKILEIYYGIIKITSDNTEWVNDPHCIVIVAEDPDTQKIFGGAKVQAVGGKYPLPVETALSKYDSRIHDLIYNDFLNGGTCEICGLWNSKEIAGMGIGSRLLSEVSIAITSQITVSSLYVLCAPSTVRMAYKMGLKLVDTIGNNGTFYYPKDNFIATLMKLHNIHDLSLATEEERENIIQLRENTNQILWQSGPKGMYQAMFDTKILNWEPPEIY